ncbi:MAG TPA: hypothetical protein VFG10_17050 [Saprospiraceae bacterium]|nr:hypothetical protein [Saprospiraceae bacterium]
MKIMLLAVFYTFIVACGPDPDPNGCSLDSVNHESYTGFVRLCNGIPGQQQDFPGEAFIQVDDSLLTFQIESTDLNVHFEYNVTVYSECKFAENEFIHILHDTISNEILGSIGLDKTSISIKLITTPCLDNGNFSGLLK